MEFVRKQNMSKIYVVMGKSSSGKDTIYKMLLRISFFDT